MGFELRAARLCQHPLGDVSPGQAGEYSSAHSISLPTVVSHLPHQLASVPAVWDGVGEKVPLPIRSPRQRTMGSCCTTGTMTTSQWSCTRAMCASATTQAATPALPSIGRASSCPPPTLRGSWAKSRWLLEGCSNHPVQPQLGSEALRGLRSVPPSPCHRSLTGAPWPGGRG